uniref:Uncharacterized protein n=1 Tax=Solanum lycopersicum TaxID=4081 RepID=A0A3Q7G2G3_SOLLC
MEIAKRIRTITGSKENVRVKADELIKLISGSICTQSISIAMFAQTAAFQTKEVYYKAIGYAEEDGKTESTSSYVDR